MDGHLIHDAVIDAFEPVVNQRCASARINILSLPFDAAMIDRRTSRRLERQVGVSHEIIPGVNIKPAVDQVNGIQTG